MGRENRKKWLFPLALLLPALLACSCYGNNTTLSVMYPYMNCADGAVPLPELPREGFPLPQLLEQVPADAGQVLLAAGGGGGANFWLMQLEGNSWHILAGPRFCTASSAEEGCWRMELSKEKEYLWRSSDGSVKGCLSTAEEAGSVVVNERDMNTLKKALDKSRSPVYLYVRASNAGWKVEPGMPEGFVFLTEATTGIREEARYATSDNFTGAPLAGYAGSRVVVTGRMASALQKAQNSLEKMGLGLLVYDGYRPGRAVECIVAWAKSGDTRMKERYYPNMTKAEIMRVGFLADPSPHSKANSVDLTLVDLDSGHPVDMGGHFDLFDSSSVYRSKSLTETQFMARRLLRETMEAAGFSALELEWWHFDLKTGKNKSVYDFIIPQ